MANCLNPVDSPNFTRVVQHHFFQFFSTKFDFVNLFWGLPSLRFDLNCAAFTLAKGSVVHKAHFKLKRTEGSPHKGSQNQIFVEKNWKKWCLTYHVQFGEPTGFRQLAIVHLT